MRRLTATVAIVGTLMLCGGPASATTTAAETDAAEANKRAENAASERKDNAEIQKNLDDVQAALSRLAATLGSQIDEGSQEAGAKASVWLKEQIDALDQAVRENSDKIGETTGEATRDASRSFADVLGAVGQSLDGLAKNLAEKKAERDREAAKGKGDATGTKP